MACINSQTGLEGFVSLLMSELTHENQFMSLKHFTTVTMLIDSPCSSYHVRMQFTRGVKKSQSKVQMSIHKVFVNTV